MSAMRLGHLTFAASFAAIGLLSLIYGDFALVWQPVPDGVPGRTLLAYLSGLMLLTCGLGMLMRRAARWAALVLAANLVAWLLLLRLPPLFAKPDNEGLWLGLGETLMLVTGGWILLAALPREDAGRDVAGGGSGSGGNRWLNGSGAMRLPRLLYGVALLPVGLSHIVYLKGTASMVPGFLPFHEGFAYLTGVGHIAAGLAILAMVLPRLAATAEAVMLSLFTLLVWVPSVAAAPGTRLPWTAFFVSAALTGAAWAVAGSLHDRGWGLAVAGAPQAAPAAPSA